MDITTVIAYCTLIISCLALLVSAGVELSKLSKKPADISLLAFLLKTILFIVLIIIIAVSIFILVYKQPNHPIKDNTTALEENIDTPTLSELTSAIESTVSPDPPPVSSTINTLPQPTEIIGTSAPLSTDPQPSSTENTGNSEAAPSISDTTEADCSPAYTQALSAYQNWEQSIASNEDMNKIIEYIDEVVAANNGIAYNRIYYTVPDTNSYFYINSDTGHAFDSLEDLANTIDDHIIFNQLRNNCGNYCITYEQHNDSFVIRLSMEYVE